MWTKKETCFAAPMEPLEATQVGRKKIWGTKKDVDAASHFYPRVFYGKYIHLPLTDSRIQKQPDGSWETRMFDIDTGPRFFAMFWKIFWCRITR
jgi:hypothetical protein